MALVLAVGAIGWVDPVAVDAHGKGKCQVSPGVTHRRGVITGTEGPDTIDCSLATVAHTINGLGGDDVITGGLVKFIIDGGAGDDTLRGGVGHDEIYAGDGNDLVLAGPGADYILGGDGNDTLYGGLSFNSDGNDSVHGEAGDDQLYGGPGDDILGGGAGDDVVFGWDGNDTLWGGDGADWLDGQDGDDMLSGDSFLAGATDYVDDLRGRAGWDSCNGNPLSGLDTVQDVYLDCEESDNAA